MSRGGLSEHKILVLHLTKLEKIGARTNLAHARHVAAGLASNAGKREAKPAPPAIVTTALDTFHRQRPTLHTPSPSRIASSLHIRSAASRQHIHNVFWSYRSLVSASSFPRGNSSRSPHRYARAPPAPRPPRSTHCIHATTWTFANACYNSPVYAVSRPDSCPAPGVSSTPELRSHLRHAHRALRTQDRATY